MKREEKQWKRKIPEQKTVKSGRETVKNGRKPWKSGENLWKEGENSEKGKQQWAKNIVEWLREKREEPDWYLYNSRRKCFTGNVQKKGKLFGEVTTSTLRENDFVKKKEATSLTLQTIIQR